MAVRSRLVDIMHQQEIENGKLLVDMASKGDTEGVKALLAQRVRVNAEAYSQSLYYKSKNYLSPLHEAARNGHVNVVRLLISDGAELDISDMFAVTPVHLAAENGHIDCLRLLLEAGASCNLGTAIKRPQWLSSTANPYVPDSRPMHLAAKNNHLDCILELLMNGADYNAVDGLGRTSMYVAAEAGHEQAVLMHLNNAYGKTILSLPAKDFDDTPLHHCVQHNLKEAVTALLQHGSDVNFRNKIGLSPLHLAVQTCNQTAIEIIHALVTKGYNTDINLPDGHGITPLEYVCFKGFRQERRPQLSAFLIAYGASFQNIKNLHGHSLLQQELSRNTDDRIILRAVVKTLVNLPSLQSLGINVDLVHKMFPPSGVPEWSFADGQRSEVSLRCYWYQNLSSSPRSLQHHCRVSVRNSLGPKRLRYISTLPLPVTLQDYLLLEFDEYR